MSGKRVAVLGATGLVGREMLKTLEQRQFQVSELVPLATPRSEGRKVAFCGEEVTVHAVNEKSFEGCDIAIFSAGGKTSKQWAPIAAKSGAIVIDNSSAWRMDPDCPLVVPEVNPNDVSLARKGIIANPNCATIEAVVPLWPLHKEAGLVYINISTYQSVSGAGKKALDALTNSAKAVLEGKEYVNEGPFPHQIAFNLLPHIGPFDDEGISEEEWKMVNESRKIMHLPELRVSGITVRVPVYRAHGESVTAQFSKPLTPQRAREILSKAKGVIVRDDPKNNVYPMPIEAANQDAVYVGRIRRDTGLDNALAMWLAADNLRKGAALNAVQIAELL